MFFFFETIGACGFIGFWLNYVVFRPSFVRNGWQGELGPSREPPVHRAWVRPFDGLDIIADGFAHGGAPSGLLQQDNCCTPPLPSPADILLFVC